MGVGEWSGRSVEGLKVECRISKSWTVLSGCKPCAALIPDPRTLSTDHSHCNFLPPPLPRMLHRLQARQPGQPVYRILWYCVYHYLTFVWFVGCYRFASWGVAGVPDAGPVLFVSNHQSHLDPIIVGLGAHKRQYFALARASLWKSALFRWLTVPLNPVAVEPNSADIKSLKRCIELLQQGQALTVYPEGTRTPDGEVKAFEPGVLLIIKRAKPVVVPVGIEGAYGVWPRWRKLPGLRGRVGVTYGEPVPPEVFTSLSNDAALALLRSLVVATREETRRRLVSL